MTHPPRHDDDLSREVRDEFDAHVAQRIDDNIARGMSPGDARLEAARRFGPVEPALQSSTRIRRRARSAWRALAADLRFAWLGMTRAPRTLASGVVVAAIGLAIALAAVQLIDALGGHPSNGIVRATEVYSALDSFDGEHPNLMSWPLVTALERDTPDLALFAWSHREAQLVDGEVRRPINVALSSARYFSTLGTRPLAGRLLDADDVSASERVAVVSARLATTMAVPRGQVPGHSVYINGQTFQIVGIAERGFRGVESADPVDVWLPITVEPLVSTPTTLPDGSQLRGFLSNPGIGWLRAGVRLPPTTDAGVAADRMSATALALARAEARDLEARRVLLRPEPWLSPFSGDRARIDVVLAPMRWAVLVTLALTAACLGSLFLGRLSDRQPELAMRAALGAPLSRLLRLTAIELGGVVLLGAGLAAAGASALLQGVGQLQLAAGISVEEVGLRLDPRGVVLLASLALAVGAGAALAPLLYQRSVTRHAQLTSTRTTRSNRRFWRLLLTTQVAAGCALLSAAILLTRTIDALRDQPLGFDANQVAFVTTDPAGAGLDADATRGLIGRARELDLGPSVRVALADGLPFESAPSMFLLPEESEQTRTFPVTTTRATGNYFDVLGIRQVDGRTFTPADEGRHVVVLSEPLANAYWPGQSAVGRFVRVGGPNGVGHEVVGVVAGIRDVSLRTEPMSRLYLPYTDDAERLEVVARSIASPGTAADLVPSLAGAVSGLDARLVVLGMGRLEALVERTVEQRVLVRMLTATLGLGSLLMIAVGVWGVSHGSLRQRWREFGIRLALGAERRDVARRALRDALVVTTAGGALGLVGAWQAGQVLKSLLFGVSSTDPIAMGAAILTVTVAAIAGAAWPARQASRINPAELLRNE